MKPLVVVVVVYGIHDRCHQLEQQRMFVDDQHHLLFHFFCEYKNDVRNHTEKKNQEMNFTVRQFLSHHRYVSYFHYVHVLMNVFYVFFYFSSRQFHPYLFGKHD
jgi:hypothetical protein